MRGGAAVQCSPVSSPGWPTAARNLRWLNEQIRAIPTLSEVGENYINHCYTLNVGIPLKFICWNLTLNVVVFAGGTFGWVPRSREWKSSELVCPWLKNGLLLYQAGKVLLFNQVSSFKRNEHMWSCEGERGQRVLSPIRRVRTRDSPLWNRRQALRDAKSVGT